jgi:hypothetical protein
MKQPRNAFPRSTPRSRLPHQFVVEALEPLSPVTKPMFGCLAVYVKEKIMLILRDRQDHLADNGVWLATSEEHHASLRREFPHMRSIEMFGTPVTSWQVLPAEASDFEEAAMHACELVIARDPRIGRVPAARRTRRSGRLKAASTSPKASPRLKATPTSPKASPRLKATPTSKKAARGRR